MRQGRNDKSAFLELGGFSGSNPDALIATLAEMRDQCDASQVDDNRFGIYYEVVGVLRGPKGVGLRIKSVWMTEHLSGVTKFITLIPIEKLDQ